MPFDRSQYVGAKYNPSRLKNVVFAEGNLKERSVEDNTARNYANYLFQNEHAGSISIDEEATNPHKDTFKNHLLRVYQTYGIDSSIMTRSANGNYYTLDRTKMADEGILKLPLWFDIDVHRTWRGLPQSQTQRQKEALGFNAACHHCGWVLGTIRGGKRLVVSEIEFDGVTQSHVDIKYMKKQAPTGRMRAMGEVAVGDSVLSCGHCHRARGNDFKTWKARDNGDD